MTFSVYIIRSELDNTLYIGHTSDIQERLQRHNQGRFQYTKSKRPWILVYKEEFPSRARAMRKEVTLKFLHRKDLLLKIIE
ncbi:MAG: GIY-YIG nuclease family protein [Candidatus Mariimomonas ferrooxydans]